MPDPMMDGPSTDIQKPPYPGATRIENGTAFDVSGKPLGAVDENNLPKAAAPAPTSQSEWDVIATAPAPQDEWAVAKEAPATASRPPAAKGGALEPLAQVASGFGGGVLQTIQGGIGLANKVLPEGAQIPNIPPQYTEPRNTGESIGNFAENVAEFAGGEGAIKGLGLIEKLGKASPQLLQLMEQFPKATKMILGMTKSGTVGAAQGAVKGTAEGKPTLESTVEGGVGGAVGGGVAEGVGMAVKPLANAMGIGTTAEQDLVRAAQPAKRNYNFMNNWEIAKNRVAKEVDGNGQFESFGDAADRLREVRQELWQNEVKPIIDKHANEQVFPNMTGQYSAPVQSAGPVPPSTNPIADAIRAKAQTIPSNIAGQTQKAIEKYAAKFDRPMTVGQMEQEMEFINGELAAKDFWTKGPKQRANLAKTDPFFASRVTALDNMRDTLYHRIADLGDPNIQALKKEYGAISAVEDEFRGRTNVDLRQRPISLKQMMAFVYGHPLGIGAAIADKIYNDPTALLNRAVAKVDPSMASMAGREAAQAAGSTAKTAIPAATSGAGRWVRVQGGDGKTREVHPEDMAEYLKRDPNAKADLQGMSPEEAAQVSQLWQAAQPAPTGGGKK